MSQLTELFTNIANAIRSKTGESEQISANNFPSAISAINANWNSYSVTVPAQSTEVTLPQLVGKSSFVLHVNQSGPAAHSSYRTIIITPNSEVSIVTGAISVTQTVTFDSQTGKITWSTQSIPATGWLLWC